MADKFTIYKNVKGEENRYKIQVVLTDLETKKTVRKSNYIKGWIAKENTNIFSYKAMHLADELRDKLRSK